MSGGIIAPPFTVVFCGDSITAGTPNPWYTFAVANINAAFAPQSIGVVNSGVGGNTVADIEAHVPTRVLQYAPQAVVYEVGVNDAGATPPATFQATYESMLQQTIDGGIPASQIWCVEIMVWGDAWQLVSGVPQWNNPAHDSDVAAINARIQAAALAKGCNFVPTRSAGLASEVINNPTGLLDNGVLTLPTGSVNQHPNTTLGQPLLSAQWLATVTLTTTTEVSTHPISAINYNNQKIWIVGDATALGTADGISEVGGCGWRNLLAIAFAASGISPTFVGTFTDGFSCSTCPENGNAPAHNCPNTDPTCPQIQSQLATWFAAIGNFDVMILEAGTKDLQTDLANHTTLAQGNFDALLAACVALKPSARFFVSNLPPSPALQAPSYGPAFAAHVASAVATYVAGGTKMYLVDHYGGIPPQGSSLTLDQQSGNTGQDFSTGGVAPAGPGGAPTPLYRGFPKMSLITYLTMTHAAP